MLMKDNKKIATLIAGKAKGPNHIDNLKYDEGGEVPEMANPATAAAEELIAALESKSPEAVAEAFSALMELCAYKE